MNSGRLTAEDLILLRGSASNVQSFRNLSDFDGSYQSSIVLPGDTAPHRLVAEWERLGKSFYLPPRIPPARALPNSPGGNLPSVHMPNHSLMGPPIGGSMASLIGPAMTPSIGPALEPVGVNDLSDTGSPSVPIELQSYRPHLITDVDLALPDSSIMSSMTADVIGASSSITARSDSRFSLMENQVLEDITDTGDPLRRGLEYLCNWIESLNGQPGVLPQYRTIEFAQEQSYGRKRKVAAKSAAGFTIDVLTEAGPTGRKVAATLIKHCFVLQRWKDGTICAIGHDERDQPKGKRLLHSPRRISLQSRNW